MQSFDFGSHLGLRGSRDTSSSCFLFRSGFRSSENLPGLLAASGWSSSNPRRAILELPPHAAKMADSFSHDRGSFETRSRGSNAPGAAEPRGTLKILSTQCERLTSSMTLIHTGSSWALIGLLTRMLSRNLYDRDRPSGGPPRQTNKFGSETTFC